MKIIRFGVVNFGCISGGIEDNTIDFANSNTIFLFGQNNTGKSAFLKAYEFFYHETQPTDDDFFERDTNREIMFELEVELDEDDKKKIKDVSKKGQYLEKEYLDSNRLSIRKIWKANEEGEISVRNETFNPSTKEWDEKHYGGIGLHGVFQTCMPIPILIKAMPTEEETNNIVNYILENKARNYLEDQERTEYKNAVQTLDELQEKMYDPKHLESYKQNVNAQFRELFNDIKIDFKDKDLKKFTPHAMGKKFEVKFCNVNSDDSINTNIPDGYNQIGHGAIRTSIFTLFMMRDIAEGIERKQHKKNYLVLFEEPELFLHPKLTKRLRSLIYKVSDETTPYQILCASHSPQMIDMTKPKSSLVRITRNQRGTKIYQIGEEFLMDPSDKTMVRQELYEILRFNPFICESFYADEVILVEGDSEALLLRGYLQKKEPGKDLFVVNCGTVNNVPFFQKIFSRFNIKYHIICDTDGHFNNEYDEKNNPKFDSHIQGSIYKQLESDYAKDDYDTGLLRIHDNNFEDAHSKIADAELKFDFSDEDIKKYGKPYCANEYWKKKLVNNLDHAQIDQVLIIKHIKEIINN